MGARGQRPAEDNNPSCGDKRVSRCPHRDHSTSTVAGAGTRSSGGKLWPTITTSTNIITKVKLLKAGICFELEFLIGIGDLLCYVVYCIVNLCVYRREDSSAPATFGAQQ